MCSEGLKMAEFKLTIADPKTGKCIQRTVTDQAAKSLVGLKIGDQIKGESIDLTGYEFTITGGSDYCGFPMRKGIQGARKKILIKKGVGFRGGKKGIKRRKTVCGDTIHDKIVQINLKVTKQGKASLAAKEEATEEKPKQEPKKEEKPAAKEEAKPVEKKEPEKVEEEVKPKEEKKAPEKKEKPVEKKEPEKKEEPKAEPAKPKEEKPKEVKNEPKKEEAKPTKKEE